jgi:hypothetical protein
MESKAYLILIRLWIPGVKVRIRWMMSNKRWLCSLFHNYLLQWFSFCQPLFLQVYYWIIHLLKSNTVQYSLNPQILDRLRFSFRKWSSWSIINFKINLCLFQCNFWIFQLPVNLFEFNRNYIPLIFQLLISLLWILGFRFILFIRSRSCDSFQFDFHFVSTQRSHHMPLWTKSIWS